MSQHAFASAARFESAAEGPRLCPYPMVRPSDCRTAKYSSLIE
jgi:hypothetical protein